MGAFNAEMVGVRRVKNAVFTELVRGASCTWVRGKRVHSVQRCGRWVSRRDMNYWVLYLGRGKWVDSVLRWGRGVAEGGMNSF